MWNRLRAFMAGRNGVDRLVMAQLIAACALNLIAQIIVRRSGERLAVLLSGAAAVLLVWGLYRAFSRNLAARQRENAAFLRLFSRVKSGASDVKYRAEHSREYKFFTCPGCRNKLRVPRGKGKIQITCPKCGQRFGGKS